MRLTSFLFGAAAGAAASWFLDPNDGTRRRHILRDKAAKYARKGGEEVGRRVDYAAGVATGAAHQAAPTSDRGDAAERLNDPALARKVETEIFRDADIPKGDVSVNVENGVVYLRGQIDRPELIESLGVRASSVDGVKGVQNLLHTPGTPAPTKDESTAGV
jgi:osmotically-inducible protein OsmY